MTDALNLFEQQFEGANIRFVQHPESKYEFGIVAEDVAIVLEASSGKDLARAVDEDWKGAQIMSTPGGPQSVTVIWEPGVYQSLAVSRKPKAKPFQKWLYEVVLPSIRKTGSYSAKPLSLVELHLQAAQILVDHEKQLTEHKQVLEKQDNRLNTIEQRFQKADEVLKQLPPATAEVPTKSVRSCVNEVLRSYSYRTGEAYQSLWNILYKEYRYRHHVDLKTRAKNEDLKTLDYAEQFGVIDKVYALAIELFGKD